MDQKPFFSELTIPYPTYIRVVLGTIGALYVYELVSDDSWNKILWVHHLIWMSTGILILTGLVIMKKSNGSFVLNCSTIVSLVLSTSFTRRITHAIARLVPESNLKLNLVHSLKYQHIFFIFFIQFIIFLFLVANFNDYLL